MSSDTVFFVFIFFSLAVIGAKKSWDLFDKDGKAHDAAHKGVIGMIARWLK